LISNLFREQNRSSVIDTITDVREVAWLVSLENTDAGLWLDIAPKTAMHKMNNQQFEIALTLRLFLPQKCLIGETMCNCKKKLDKEGIHFCSGCSYDGARINTHDRFRDQLERIIKYCGIHTKSEERGAFLSGDPACGKRPDISIFNLPNKSGKQILDVQITSPVPPNNPKEFTMKQAKIPLRAANLAHQTKVNNYKDIAPSNNLGFQSIIFEITGRMHSSTQQFLTEILAHSSDRKAIVPERLWHYWISTLMITLQNGLADGIMKRANSRFGAATNFENSKEVVMEFGYLNSGIKSF
jgi:hypothetical protein